MMQVLSERWKSIALLLFLLLLALLLTTLRTRAASPTSFFEAFILSLILPLQDVTARLAQRTDDLWNRYINLIQVRHENRLLRQQLAELQSKFYQYQEAYLQQQRLNDLLGFRTAAFPNQVAAEVVSVDPSQWAESVTINKGTRDQLRRDLAVVTHQGLVGRTIKLAPHFATVLLLTDRRSAVDVLVQRTRARGIVVGKSRRLCELRYVDIREDIQLGDSIITSGLGKVYPKGLLVGTVISVRRQSHELFHDLEVKPATDLSKLEEVLILIP
ncbi:Cell shape-determining protein MreC [Candidatus Entotheonellaceae bacterium PAL068K]